MQQCSQIEMKAMIWNQYNFLTPCVQDTKGKEGHTESHGNQNTTSRKPKGQFLSQIIGQTAIQSKNFTRTHMQRHTMTETVNHSRSTTLEQSVKTLLGGLNRFYIAKTLALSSTVVYRRHLFSLRGGFLTHQCNISENIKIERIQRWNNAEDLTARNN